MESNVRWLLKLFTYSKLPPLFDIVECCCRWIKSNNLLFWKPERCWSWEANYDLSTFTPHSPFALIQADVKSSLLCWGCDVHPERLSRPHICSCAYWVNLIASFHWYAATGVVFVISTMWQKHGNWAISVQCNKGKSDLKLGPQGLLESRTTSAT